MTAAVHHRLPNRRPNLTASVDHNGATIAVSAGLDPATGRLAEIFITAGKEGSETRHVLEDAAVIVSLALQHGIPLDALARSLSRVSDGPLPVNAGDAQPKTVPASMIGAAIDAVRRMLADLEGEKS